MQSPRPVFSWYLKAGKWGADFFEIKSTAKGIQLVQPEFDFGLKKKV
jgi:hypothetical protein